ncbi:MAG: glycosyltransferase family 2 protein [Clostridiales bacterium]|nr:glycosyltransferase family 2 protein [Clostridiales bacterium]
MKLFDDIMYIINTNILMTIIGVAFGIQVLYILLFFVRAKKYPEAKTKHRFGIVIPARNESDVIAETVKCILSSKYPKDMFDVYVVADNCTDNTAELARAAGAIVFERTDPDPKHHKAGYALKFLFEKIMELHPAGYYEAFIKFDADNLMEPDYISRMNDAFDAGVKCARGYSNSKNLGQNMVTGISGLWYIRDCRFSSNFRSAIGQGTMLGGAGMMFAAEIIEKHGWDCLSASDDTEFTMRRLNEDKIKTMYVKDAVVYEDQPSTIKDTFKRYKRMSGALCSLFFTQGCKSFLLFFKRWKWTYLDMFITLMFIPVCVLMCIWIPIYYAYYLIYHGIMGFKYGVVENLTNFWNCFNTICYALAFAFVLSFILQALLAIFLERKRIKVPAKKMIPVAFAFPFFMIIYAAAITIGVFSKPKWSQIKRNTTSDVVINSDVQDAPAEEVVPKAAYATEAAEDIAGGEAQSDG